MGHQQKLGSYGKNRILGPKTEISGPKKVLTSGWTPCSGHNREKLCKQKSTLFQNKYQSFSKFWVFFLEKKTDF